MTNLQRLKMKELQARRSAESMAADFGEDAAHEGKGKDTNPYPENSTLHNWWSLGWLECHPDDFGIEG
jgi:hypothetical protein